MNHKEFLSLKVGNIVAYPNGQLIAVVESLSENADSSEVCIKYLAPEVRQDGEGTYITTLAIIHYAELVNIDISYEDLMVLLPILTCMGRKNMEIALENLRRLL